MRSYLALAFITLAIAPLQAFAGSPPSAQASTILLSGPATTVFDHSTQACEAIDYPDAPARAIRTRDGHVQLYATHFVNRRMVGADLLHLRGDCRIVYRGAENDDPAAFDDREWITAVTTTDGITINAIVHNEYQGHRRPWMCPTGNYMDCWYNSLTAAVSTDGGLSFHRKPGEQALVAAIPSRFEVNRGKHVGYFNPTGMVAMDGFHYMMAFATTAGAQTEGNCLMRTGNVGEAGAWRAWDGHAFQATFTNPYGPEMLPGVHTCNIVGQGKLRWPVTSLVQHERTGVFIATMMNGAAASNGGGVWYATSRDLIQWSEPTKLIIGEGQGHWKCGEPLPMSYPSLLDPGSHSPDFSTIGDDAQLFYTQYTGPGCKLGDNRNLFRIPVHIAF